MTGAEAQARNLPGSFNGFLARSRNSQIAPLAVIRGYPAKSQKLPLSLTPCILAPALLHGGAAGFYFLRFDRRVGGGAALRFQCQPFTET